MLKIIYIIMLTLTLMTTPIQNNNIEAINGIVCSIDSEYIIIDTEDGNGWAIYYEDGYVAGDKVYIR